MANGAIIEIIVIIFICILVGCFLSECCMCLCDDDTIKNESDTTISQIHEEANHVEL